jgi:two-component system, response regulator RegA
MMPASMACDFFPRTVLLAEPSQATARCLSSQLREMGCEQVWAAEDADEASNVAAIMKPDLVVMEVCFRDHDGISLLRDLRERSPETRCVVLTAYGSIASAVRSLRLGATAFLTKPTTAHEILRACQTGYGVSDIDDSSTAHEHMTLRRATWEYLQRVFHEAPSVSEAARRLGIDRTSLRRMLSRQAPRR